MWGLSRRPSRSRQAPRARRPPRAGGICACCFLSSTPSHRLYTGRGVVVPEAGSDRENDLAELLAGFEALVRGADLLEREYRVDDRQRTAACHELVGAG